MASTTTGMRWARSIAHKAAISRPVELPIFLCPALTEYAAQRRQFRSVSLFAIAHGLQQSTRLSHSGSYPLQQEIHHNSIQKHVQLPQQCAGCGALSQITDDGKPGFYSLSRRSVKEFLTGVSKSGSAKRLSEQKIVESSLGNLGGVALKSLNLDMSVVHTPQFELPFCDRCQKLSHHGVGVSIHHPSIESIHDTILESPHKYNHVYHIIDAVDFPMSLIPRLHMLLHLTPQRSLNRRSKSGTFSQGKKNELSFVITRSDLLAPLKTQVDSLMPYLVNTLRDALGSVGRDVRLGNVRCVSAKRNWWTKELKEDIWNRGGGNWMVGKFNVGKSQLFESVFPKGRCGSTQVDQSFFPITADDPSAEYLDGKFTRASEEERIPEHFPKVSEKFCETELYNTNALLPPVQTETDFPVMPLVSPLPGTTASPIRIPFGDGRGELIDLPGLSRGDLELYVQEPYRSSLVMRSRIRPNQQVIKPGQSLLLGGFIRITPTSPDTIILAYAFTPIAPHLTSTEKAVGIQTQQRVTRAEGQNIAVDGVGEKIKSAGKFTLKWDVTKQRSGPVTATDALGIKVTRLPYRVLSTDILIEGCGWVELVAQVRAKTVESSGKSDEVSGSNPVNHNISTPKWPEVEVFSPEGKFIAARSPLGAWALSGQMRRGGLKKGRPRKSMKGMKRKAKAFQRMNR